MSTASHSTAPESLKKLAGKYLTFVLGNEAYGIAVLKVREIIRLIDITPVPRMPRHIRGVINLRGKVVPILDLRLRFALSDAAMNEHTCTIVSQVTFPNGVVAMTGFVVDNMEEVLQIQPDELEPAPDFGAQLDTEFIVAMAKVKGGVKVLLDIDKIVASEFDAATLLD